MKKLNKKRVFGAFSLLYVMFIISTIFFIERNAISITLVLISIPLTIPAFNFGESFIHHITK